MFFSFRDRPAREAFRFCFSCLHFSPRCRCRQTRTSATKKRSKPLCANATLLATMRPMGVRYYRTGSIVLPSCIFLLLVPNKTRLIVFVLHFPYSTQDHTPPSRTTINAGLLDARKDGVLNTRSDASDATFSTQSFQSRHFRSVCPLTPLEPQSRFGDKLLEV